MGRTSDAGDRLVLAMARLVHRRGYAAVGVEDVCREAGVKKGSFYHFFPSKRALMIAALKHHWRTLEPMMQRAFDPAFPPLQRFQMMAAGMTQLEAETLVAEGQLLGCPFGKLASEVGRDEPELAQEIDRAFCGYAALYEQALQEAQGAGSLDTDVDPKECADAMMAYVQGVSMLARTRNDPSILRRLLPKALQLAAVTPPERAVAGSVRHTPRSATTRTTRRLTRKRPRRSPRP